MLKSIILFSAPLSYARVAFFGDIMFSRGIKDEWVYDLEPCDLLSGFNSYFQEDMPKIANFENPATGESPLHFGHKTFNAPLRFMSCVKKTFDLVSLANNHMMDQEAEGLRLTIENFDRYKIAHIGVGSNLKEAWDYEIIGEFAVIAASFTCYNFDTDKMCSEIARIDNDSDYLKRTIERIKRHHPEKIITMYVHFGVEYDTYANILQIEYAHKVIDMGVEFVVGHHPHVAQEIEFYKGVPIFYSLGNAVFDQDWSTFTVEGLAIVAFTEFDE